MRNGDAIIARCRCCETVFHDTPGVFDEARGRLNLNTHWENYPRIQWHPDVGCAAEVIIGAPTP